MIHHLPTAGPVAVSYSISLTALHLQAQLYINMRRLMEKHRKNRRMFGSHPRLVCKLPMHLHQVRKCGVEGSSSSLQTTHTHPCKVIFPFGRLRDEQQRSNSTHSTSCLKGSDINILNAFQTKLIIIMIRSAARQARHIIEFACSSSNSS